MQGFGVDFLGVALQHKQLLLVFLGREIQRGVVYVRASLVVSRLAQVRVLGVERRLSGISLLLFQVVSSALRFGLSWRFGEHD